MSVAERYDALLLDLDGTVYTGADAIPAAVDGINGCPIPALYVTNNASRPVSDVAEHLRELGLDATPGDVFTSAHAGAHILTEHCPPGAVVLVVGTDSLVDVVRDAGFIPTRTADDRPAAVVHGHSMDTGWRMLSEAALAITRGALYVATNLDASIPRERGMMVGNGSMVAAVTNTTGVTPLSAGKPAPLLFTAAAQHCGAKRPLAIGDRLNTDIAGGNAAGFDTLHVLTGVSGPQELMTAPVEYRPTFTYSDLSCLTGTEDLAVPAPRSGFRATADLATGTITLSGGQEGAAFIDAVTTVLHCAWQHPAGAVTTVTASPTSAAAHRALEQWW